VVHVRVGNREAGNIRHIELVGLRPVSRVFAFHLLDSLLTAITKISICSYDLVFQQSEGLSSINAIICWGIGHIQPAKRLDLVASYANGFQVHMYICSLRHILSVYSRTRRVFAYSASIRVDSE
jgi:hypothetical protein